MNKYLKQLHISQNVNMVSGIKCNNCQRIQPTMPEYVFLNPNYRCVCLQEAEPLDTDFLVISPTQEEIKELDDMVMKEVKCDLCQGNYSYYSKSHHEKSRKHRMVILEKELKELKLKI